jgi:ubiquinone/menaquinone biosynthesis C-methylase UbiE
VAPPVSNVPLPPPQRRHLAAAVAALEPDRILVIRSRRGTTVRALADSCPGAEVIGADASEARVAGARRAAARDRVGNVRFVASALDRLPFADQSFDVAAVMLGLHEMPDAERSSVLSEARRVIRPRGWLFALEPDRPARRPLAVLADLWFRYKEEEWARRLLGSGLCDELTRAGFALESKRALGAGFFQLVVGRVAG